LENEIQGLEFTDSAGTLLMTLKLQHHATRPAAGIHVH